MSEQPQASLEDVVVEADGGSRGNPGPAGYGAVVLDPVTGAVLAERKDAIGVETNNVAEYRGLIAGLEAAAELGARRVAVRMDSKLVVEQMAGRWKIKHERLRPLAMRAGELRRNFETVTFSWVPRERNRTADRLANEAMDAAAGRPAPTPTRAPREAAAPPSGGDSGWTPATTTPTRLLLVRHGSTAHSGQMRFSGRNDLPLDAAGMAQAAALATRLREEPVAAVVASPLRRAEQTAQAIAAALGVPVRTDADLMELDFGQWEGLTSREAATRDPSAMAGWFESSDAAPPAGESWAELARRVRRARDRLVAAHPRQQVVVVSHVTPIKVLLLRTLDAPLPALRRLHLDIAAISAIDYFDDGAASLRLFNDTSHLR